jgi:integrase/recombinase XerC/integrase/recombinase XerD
MMLIENDHGYLLHNILKNRQGNYFDVDNYMRKLKDKLNLNKLHAHMFRHSLATLWLQEGADLLSVMNVLGHKNMETTQRYQHANKKHIKKTYKKYKID